MSHGMRRSLPLMGMVTWVACGAPQAGSEPAPTVSLSIVAPASSAPEGAAVVEDTSSSAPQPKGRRLRVRSEPRAWSLTGPQVEAPCDFHRLYRGGVGKDSNVRSGGGAAMSVMLEKSASGELTGTIRYDRAGAIMVIDGGRAHADGSFQLSEKGAGTFVGKCNASGVLSGTFTHRSKKQPFTWFPRPTSWPALHQRTRTKKVKMCEVHDTGIRFFGGAGYLNSAVDRSLDSGLFASHVQDVGTCAKVSHHESHTVVLFARDDVLTIQTGSSVDYGGAHPMHSAGGSGTTVDLRTGRLVTLRDIVPSFDELLPLMPACVADYLESVDGDSGEVTVTLDTSEIVCGAYPFANYLWGCDPQEKNPEPTWALVDGGIAVLAMGHGHVEAFRDGSGPIISWAALARAGLLAPTSPVAHLWKDVAPAESNAPACIAGFTGDRLVHWSVLAQ